MSEGTIDNLVIEVSSNASSSVTEIKSIAEALQLLDSSVGGSATKLTKLSASVSQLKTAVSGLSLGNLTKLNELKVSKTVANNIGGIATALGQLPADSASRIAPLTSLTQLSGLKISSTIANNITKIGAAVAGLPAGSAANLSSVVSALVPLRELNGLKLTSVINTLKKLPEVLANYETLNMSALIKQLDELTPRLSNLAAAVNRLKVAYQGMPASLRTVASSARTVVSANKTLATSNNKLRSSFVNLAAKVTSMSVAFNYVWNALSKCVSTVNDYIEDMNLFQASMGSATESALEYAQTVQDAMGIDMGEWARNQGVFQTLITGMGVTAEKATVMSQQLTQLGYDISSFYNISVEDAMTKIQSGVAGELEPLRRLGWDLSNARMQLELTNLGIDESVQNMTQAEKVALRYYLIMNQVTITHGDMARTIASPANQLRVLQAQVTLAARAIGNLLIPMLNAVLPYVIGMAKAVRLLAIEIANLFGIDATFEVDYSTLDTSGIATASDDVDDLGDAASDANDKVEELKNSVMGFDELNKLSAPTDTSDASSSAANAGTSDLSLPIDTYDFLDGLDDYITNLSDEIGEKLAGAFKKVLPWAAAIGSAIAGWKIGNAIADVLGLADKFKFATGLALALGGAVLYVYEWLDAWNNGVDWTNLTGMIVGATALVGGLALAFGPVAAAVGAVVTLLGIGIVSLKDMATNGASMANELGAAFSGLNLGILGDLGKFAGELGKLGDGTMSSSSIIGRILISFSKMGGFVGEIASKAIILAGKFAPLLETVGKFAGPLGAIISAVDLIINGIQVIQDIGSGEDIKFENMFGINTAILGIGMLFGPWGLLVAAIVDAVIDIAALIYNNWDGICAFFSGLPEWFDTNVCQPVSGFFSGLGEGIAGFFSGAWDSIVGVWTAVGDWFNDNVVTPVMDFFSPLVEWFSKLFDSIGQSASDIFYNIGVFAQGCVTTVQLVWSIVGDWFNQNVIVPVTTFFTNMWNTLCTTAQNAWNFVSNVFSVVADWFNRNVITPVANFFTSLWNNVCNAARSAWNSITGTFSSIASWFNGTVIQPIYSFFSNMWSGIQNLAQSAANGICNIFNGILGSIRSTINSVISFFNSCLSGIFGVINGATQALRDFEIAGQHPFDGMVSVSVAQIPYLASGGQVSSGQLFVARENGKPEMVGQMGGKSTVANNDQIVEAIEGGVLNAMLQALPMFKQDEGGDVTLVLQVGHEELARAVNKGNASMARKGQLSAQFSY